MLQRNSILSDPTTIIHEYFHSAYKALIHLSGQKIEGIRFTLKDFTMNVKSERMNYIASGSFKSVYSIGRGKVIAVKNLNYGVTEHAATRWCQAVHEEVTMANQLRNIGLRTLDYEIVDIAVADDYLPALRMTDFSALALQGFQVRDAKNHLHYGSTCLFGSIENIKNDEYIKFLFEDIINDIVILIANGIRLLQPFDTFNIVIENSNKTPLHDPSQLDSFVNRKQKVRLFFYDFSDKNEVLNCTRFSIVEENGAFDNHQIQRYAESYLYHAYECLIAAISKSEMDRLNLSSHEEGKTFINASYQRVRPYLLNTIIERVKEKYLANRTDLIQPLASPLDNLMNWIDKRKEVERNNPFIVELTQYIKIRQEEAAKSNTHYNGVVGFFKGMDSETKINAAKKMIKFESGDDGIMFTELEVEALNNSRLKKIMQHHQKYVPSSHILKTSDSQSMLQALLTLPIFRFTMG